MSRGCSRGKVAGVTCFYAGTNQSLQKWPTKQCSLIFFLKSQFKCFLDLIKYHVSEPSTTQSTTSTRSTTIKTTTATTTTTTTTAAATTTTTATTRRVTSKATTVRARPRASSSKCYIHCSISNINNAVLQVSWSSLNPCLVPS